MDDERTAIVELRELEVTDGIGPERPSADLRRGAPLLDRGVRRNTR